MTNHSRRDFLKQSLCHTAIATTAIASTGIGPALLAAEKKKQAAKKPVAKVQYGLVTYNWGKDWTLSELIKNCTTADVLGVELRTTHAHQVERTLTAPQRENVKKQFSDSPVTLVGIGSNERFDHPDATLLKKAIADTKDFIKLSHDVGGSGVKVKPNSFHKNVDPHVTIEQIGKSLNELGKFGLDYGQQIRLEVHGKCAHLPTIKKILDIADHKNVAICWNCNKQDLEGDGLEHNFNLVKSRMGATTHIHDVVNHPYPHAQFFDLLAKTSHQGWLMLEEGKPPKGDITQALAKQKKYFQLMWQTAQLRARI